MADPHFHRAPVLKAETFAPNKTTSAIDPARLLAWQGDMPEQLKDDLKRAADTITRLQAAGQRLADVGDDKLATRKEWADAIANWRSAVGGE